MTRKTTYAQKLKDPKWQRKRLEILSRDNWKCRICGATEKTLHVHHKSYQAGKEPWEYSNFNYSTICEDCHEEEHATRTAHEQALLQNLKRAGLTANAVWGLAAAFEYVVITEDPTLNKKIYEVIAPYVEKLLEIQKKEQ